MIIDPADKELHRLTQAAVRYLAKRDRSRLELERYLTRKAAVDDPALIQTVLGRIEEMGLLDNLHFSRQWAKSRLHHGKGPRLISLELQQKGVDTGEIESVIHFLTAEEVAQSALEVGEKYLHKYRHAPVPAQRQRLYRYLLSRGFDNQTIRSVIDDCLPKR